MAQQRAIAPPEPGQPFPEPMSGEGIAKVIQKTHRAMLVCGALEALVLAAGIRCLVICAELDPLALPFRPMGHSMTLALDRQYAWGFLGIAMVFFGALLAAGKAIAGARKLDELAFVGAEQDGFILVYLKSSPEGMAFREKILSQKRRFTHAEWALARAFHEEQERRLRAQPVRQPAR